MIPANAFTPTPQYSNFQVPYDRQYTPLSQTVLGGNAIGDGSAGRQVKNWVVSYNGSSIVVSPEGGAQAFSLPTLNVLSVSLAFDNNMGIVLAWQTKTSSNLYFFNTQTSSYTTSVFNGTTSCRVCVDDARDFNSGASDVIFGYTTGTNLCYRQQRDRYGIEYVIKASSKKLRRMAPTISNRLQFESV